MNNGFFKTDWSYDKYLFDLAFAQVSTAGEFEEAVISDQLIIQQIKAIKEELHRFY